MTSEEFEKLLIKKENQNSTPMKHTPEDYAALFGVNKLVYTGCSDYQNKSIKEIIILLQERRKRYKTMSDEERARVREFIGFPKPYYLPPENSLEEEGVLHSVCRLPPRAYNPQTSQDKGEKP